MNKIKINMVVPDEEGRARQAEQVMDSLAEKIEQTVSETNGTLTVRKILENLGVNELDALNLEHSGKCSENEYQDKKDLEIDCIMNDLIEMMNTGQILSEKIHSLENRAKVTRKLMKLNVEFVTHFK